jgi:hypothetical protein
MSKTKHEKQWMDAVAQLGCIPCLKQGYETPQVELNHVSTGTGMGKRSSHYEVFGCCHPHHRTGGKGVALHAGVETWEEKYGTQISHLQTVLEMIPAKDSDPAELKAVRAKYSVEVEA